MPQRNGLEPRLSHHADGDSGADVLHRGGRVRWGAGHFQPDGHAAGRFDDDHLAVDDHDHHTAVDDHDHHTAVDDDHDHYAAADHDDVDHGDVHHDDHDAGRAAVPHEPDGDADELQRGGSPLDALERVRLGLQCVPQSEHGHDVHLGQASERDPCLP